MAEILKQEMYTKVTLANIGNPSAVKDETSGRLPMGHVIGIARDIVERKSPDGSEKFVGIAGNFMVKPAKESERYPVARSSIGFFPPFIIDPIIEALCDKDETGKLKLKPGNPEVKFAFEVSAITAKNPQGYSWAVRSMMPATADDPLASLVQDAAKQIAGPATPPAQGGAGTATEAPARKRA